MTPAETPESRDWTFRAPVETLNAAADKLDAEVLALARAIGGAS